MPPFAKRESQSAHDRSHTSGCQFFCFLVYSMFSAPSAIFFQLQALFNCFLVLSRKIVVALADGALKFYQIFLRHNYCFGLLFNLTYFLAWGEDRTPDLLLTMQLLYH